MPANLTPEYLAAEKKYRQAKTVKEKLEALQEMLRTIPKHKGTDHMQGDIKRRIARLKQEAKKKTVRKVFSHYVEPEGIGQAFLVGPPNSGKSSLLRAVTSATPQVAPYPFTTTYYTPGMMRYENVWIQLVDMPPVSKKHTPPWVGSVVRYGDLLLLVLSLASDDILEEAEEAIEVLEASKVHPAANNEKTGQLESGVASIKTIAVGTHSLDPDAEIRLALLNELWGDRFPIICVDKNHSATLKKFRRCIYEALGVIRVYTKEPGKRPDLHAPFVLERGATVGDLAEKIHKQIAQQFQYARLWGSGKFDGQRVNADYLLQEGDIVEIHT